MAFNKRVMASLFLSFFLSVLFLALFSSPAAAVEGGITDSIYTTLNSVFGFMDDVQVSLIGASGDAGEKATFWARFLIWILVFTIMYYVLRMFLPGNIAGTIGFVLAIISVVGIPGTLLRDIIINYSIIASLVLLGAPIVGLLLFRFKMKSQHGGHVLTHVGFVLLDVLLIIFITKFLTTLRLDFSTAGTTWESVSQWAMLSVVIMVVILVFDILDLIRSTKGTYKQPYMPSWMPGAANVHQLTERAERATADAERLANMGTRLGQLQEELEGVNARIAAGETTLASQRLALTQRINRVLRDLETLQRGL